MYKIIFSLIICLFTAAQSYAQIFITGMPDCSKVTFYEDNITIGSCRLNVYMAYTDEQKICGMLNFTDDTFIKDGMLFVDNDEVSRPIADKICAKYPFENIRLTCGCKDFNEHYLRCIKKMC